MGCAQSMANRRAPMASFSHIAANAYLIDREESLTTVHESDDASRATEFDQLEEKDADAGRQKSDRHQKHTKEVKKIYRQTRSNSGQKIVCKAAKFLLSAEDRRDSGISLDYDTDLSKNQERKTAAEE